MPLDLAAIYCEFEDPKIPREPVARFSRARTPLRNFRGAAAHIQRNGCGEEWVLKASSLPVRQMGISCRSYDHLPILFLPL